MTLDRIIELFSPVVTVSPTGQRITKYESQGLVHAAFNPVFGTEAEHDRLYTAQEIDVFVIRQFTGPDPTWVVLYDGKYFNVLSTLEGMAPKDTTRRGRYMALRSRNRDNEQILLV
jgi:head-tail adaptor